MKHDLQKLSHSKYPVYNNEGIGDVSDMCKQPEQSFVLYFAPFINFPFVKKIYKNVSTIERLWYKQASIV
jgi:hypothetical protein